MASNNQSVTGVVTFQDGDDLSESNLTKRAAKTNQTDYVERGLGFAVDSANGTVTIGSGFAIVRDGTQAYEVRPDQAADLTLADSSGVNYIYLAIEPGTDDSIYYHIDTDKSAPTDPALYLGQADGSDGSSTEQNREPDIEVGRADADVVSTDRASIAQVVATVYPTSNQSLASATGETLAFDSIEDEDANVIDADTASNQLTVQKSGTYLTMASVQWGADTGWSTGDAISLQPRINGSIVDNGTYRKVSTNRETIQTTYISRLAQNDTIDYRVEQNSGTSQTIRGFQNTTRLSVIRIG